MRHLTAGLLLCVAVLSTSCFQAVDTDGGTGGGGATGGGGGGSANGGGGAVGGGGGSGGGSAMDAGTTCGELSASYQAALTQARSCTPSLPVVHCQFARPSVLGCSCATMVENPGELDAIAATFARLKCAVACPAVACHAVLGGNCELDASGAGRCVDTF